VEVDLVITDVTMPKKSGIEAALAVRDGGVEVPILFVTGFLSRRVLDEISAIGNAAVLLKPFEMAELEQQIAELMAGRPSGSVR
jgi:DNA-binding NarL/FixJ family response regulator